MATLLRSKGDAKDEAQRFAAQYAARPAVTPQQRAQDLADKMIAAIRAGELSEARELALALRPMLALLPEGN